MAKSPSKRRGIQLGARAESADALALLNAPHSDSRAPENDAAPEMMKEQLSELRRLGADLDLHWERQLDQLQEQSRQLTQQRAAITQQSHQLQTLKKHQQSARRAAVLLSLLALTSVTAAGFHAWPRLQDLAGEWDRMSTGFVQLAPKLEAVHGQVDSLSSNMDQIGDNMMGIRKDVSEIRSQAASSTRVAANVPESEPVTKTTTASARTAVYTLPRNRSSRAHPYWNMHGMRPW